MLTKLFSWLNVKPLRTNIKYAEHIPKIITRDNHNVSRKQISKNALKVLYRLKKTGYQGYLVGGGIRDLLLRVQPKDFDIATDAPPEEIRKLFRNCRLIGRRFRLAHIYFGHEIIEVATFRATHSSEHQTEEGMLLRDNVYGMIDEDALRRDFTINAIYYNIQDFSLVDYVGGLEDIKKRQLRVIGDPIVRYREDPVRMLRAIRLASKLDLKLHKDTEKPIAKLAYLLKDVSSARLFEEYLKIFSLRDLKNIFYKLMQYGLYAELFSQVEPFLKVHNAKDFIDNALSDTNKRIENNKPISPVFLLAIILWHPFLENIKTIMAKGNIKFSMAEHDAFTNVITTQKKTIMFPRRFTYIVQDVWFLQFKLVKLSVSNVVKCYKSQAFRMAYDFLMLRAKVEGEEIQYAAKWWHDYLQAGKNTRKAMLKKLPRNRRK